MSETVSTGLSRVAGGETLSSSEIGAVIEDVMGGNAEPLQVAALLACLRARGETHDEIAGAARAMRSLAVEVPAAPPGAIDTCGTGGDGAGTFNVSTVAALVVAGAGVPVAKHGNRAATSRCGSAEVLEALGVAIEIPPTAMARSVHENGIGFLYARSCHPAMATVAPIRAALGIPTIFNRLGPLTNPMRPEFQLLGVGRHEMMASAATGVAELEVKRAGVVHGEDGLDEVSTTARTHVVALEDGQQTEFSIEAGEHVPVGKLSDIQGGDPEHNAALAHRILAGETGPCRDIVVLNAAAALCVAGRAEALGEAVNLASQSLDSGAAAATLERWAKFTQEQAG